ncbi:MAG: LVIVD repeat-containing protein, partial [Actinomycetota bacterium]
MNRKLIGILAAGLLLVPTAAGGTTAAAPRHSANLQLVAQIPGGGGTDLEFFSRTLSSYLDSNLNTITPPEPLERHFAMVGNQEKPAEIVDITSPEQPYVVTSIPNCSVSQGDVQVTKDGMVAAIAKQGGGTCRTVTGQTLSNGSALVDLSDVYNPRVVGRAVESLGSHNNTIHPSGDYLYISTSELAPTNGTDSRIPIFDISNPANPVKVRDFMIPVNGPHDIRFSPDGKRAYLAGISAFHIVNTEDPKNPSIISTIVPPGGSIGHDTLVTPDKAFLFLGDEGGGGGRYPCPGGALYVYDIRSEATPIFLGAAQAGGGPVTTRHIDEVAPGGVPEGCTSHVMELNPDNKSLTIGWYSLGTRVFDFSALYDGNTPRPLPALSWGRFGANLVETGYMVPDGANTWSAKQYAKVPGYIFSDDRILGLYVTK